MTKEGLIIRIALGNFYSRRDEDRFFEGLQEISAIKSVRGAGTDLIIKVNASLMDRNDMRELLAIFRRYGISRKPLKVFSTKKRFAWLREENWRKILHDLAD